MLTEGWWARLRDTEPGSTGHTLVDVISDEFPPRTLVDLPGTYSLDPQSPDEQVTRDVLFGRQAGERTPSALVVVIDATNLDNHLRFVLQLVALGLPTIVALNMIDMATRDGLEIDIARLSAELGVPVVPLVE